MEAVAIQRPLLGAMRMRQHVKKWSQAAQLAAVSPTKNLEMSHLFDPNLEAPDNKYSLARDEPRFVSEKQYAETLWERFSPYADPDFKSEIARQFRPRFWEMYLGCALLEMGIKLVEQGSSKGPDFHFRLNDKSFWIEATSPGAGDGPDKVPGYSDQAMDVPEEKIILRLTSSICKKVQAYQRYKKQGLVEAGDGFVIAINGRGIPHVLSEGHVPFIVKSVLPFGDLTVILDAKEAKPVKEGFAYRGEIEKEFGSEVQTRAFRDSKYSCVSGIIYSLADLWNLPSCLGGDFLFVHNPFARIPLRRGWLSRARSAWVEDERLIYKDGEECG